MRRGIVAGLLAITALGLSACVVAPDYGVDNRRGVVYEPEHVTVVEVYRDVHGRYVYPTSDGRRFYSERARQRHLNRLRDERDALRLSRERERRQAQAAAREERRLQKRREDQRRQRQRLRREREALDLERRRTRNEQDRIRLDQERRRLVREERRLQRQAEIRDQRQEARREARQRQRDADAARRDRAGESGREARRQAERAAARAERDRRSRAPKAGVPDAAGNLAGVTQVPPEHRRYRGKNESPEAFARRYRRTVREAHREGLSVDTILRRSRPAPEK